MQKLGAAGIELLAFGELAPANLSQTGRRELRHLFSSHGLETAALYGPLRRGLAAPENHEARLDYLRDALTLSYELGGPIVVIEPGPLPTDEKDPNWPIFTEALIALGRHADRIGARLALETGLETGKALAEFLGRFEAGGLAASLNPGNLLVNGHKPLEAVRELQGRIAIVHAQDGRAASANRATQELPLGHGDIDWLALLAALEQTECRGWMTITRGGMMTLEEAGESVAFLKRVAR